MIVTYCITIVTIKGGGYRVDSLVPSKISGVSTNFGLLYVWAK
jgi:hypothetical protein